MKRMMLLLLALVCLAPAVAGAYTGTIEPPVLKEGQFVYTIPGGFVPNGIGQAGLLQIQGVAAKLHHPFYVVLVNDLPNLTAVQYTDAQRKGYQESGDGLKASYTIDRLAEDWAQMYPDLYDVSHSSVFLLSFNPRQYRILAGTEWKTKLGLEKGALKPFEQFFLRKVTGTPKDPRGGIVDLIMAFDDHVFDLTDPALLAARQEAEQVRQRDALLQNARGSLDKQIVLLSELLKEDKDYLPDDLASYKSTLVEAKGIRQTGTPEKMLSFASAMVPVVEVLQKYVSEKKSAATWATLLQVVKLMALFFALFAFMIFLLQRRGKYRRLRGEFLMKVSFWDQKVKNAAAHYVSSYGERDAIVAMDDTEGQTRNSWNNVTRELDNIWVVVRALEDHVKQCVLLAGKGSYFNFKPVAEATQKLSASFEFDTGLINKFELFGKETKQITITPAEAEASLQKRFEAVQQGWGTLKDAAEFRIREACQHLPHTTMDAIQKAAEERGIPAGWYSDHPLAGDDESDKSVWATADALRWKDPIAYKQLIEDFRDVERRVNDRMGILIAAIDEVTTCRAVLGEIPEFSNTTVASDDDPNITAVTAQQAENAFRASLTTCMDTLDVSGVQGKAQVTSALYRKVKEQAATITAAVQIVDSDVAGLGPLQERTRGVIDSATVNLNRAAKVHADTREGQRAYEAYTALFSSAKKTHKEAQDALTAGKHLLAFRKAAKAKSLYAEASQTAHQLETYVAKLDAAKADCENKLGQLKKIADATAQKIRKYNGDASSIKAFRTPTLGDGPVDYNATLAIIDAGLRSWDNAAQRAQRDYEAEQSRIRAAEEAERRRRRDEQEEEERRHRRVMNNSYYSSDDSYYSSGSSSHSSSDGDSWGGGGGSSFGGDFGGGGSSSSGGGW